MSSNINLINTYYDWSNLTLLQFLNEGNTPSSYKKFFKRYHYLIQEISKSLQTDSQTNIIYPPPHQVFKALYLTPLHKIKTVIIGMDPYHNGSAVGLAFSVKHGNPINPSLRSIYKELENEGFQINKNGDLTPWTNQGVLLLNTALTVQSGTPDSHSSLWWNFTRELITFISKHNPDIHWILLGKNAHQLTPYINSKNLHCTSHPMPLAANRPCGKFPAFFESNIFRNIPGIDWTIL